MLHDFIKIDKSRFKDAVKAYWLWKELNSIIKNSHNRGINFPETISESLMCYALGFELNRGTGGDARNPETGEVCEVKATSNWDRDTSSFSPKEEFDSLYFVRLNQRDDHVYIYDLQLDSNSLKKIPVSKTQTVEDQQKQGRRPRFSIIKQIIEANNLDPIAFIDLRKEKVKKL
ncbi:Bsp6I family type II restriction endonuclease [Gracilibacillus thailandensis]|uniref:Bsp6I family restriction endonuclease n=1 Tax=Gracilibacillus thailandensis TaxID=563735 RepID=A0A6N7QW26_9BACI|nr:Bsp6I family type II restriction endonuclease [Gracilibacillus thailandensis]MRI66218.1 Bsp6I family restriction endonuclease [Gracilibacillus thailandensis]